MRRYSNRVLGGLVLGDIAAIVFSLWLADRFRFALPFGAPLGGGRSTFLNPFLYVAIPSVWLLLGVRWGIYDSMRRRWHHVVGNLFACSAFFNLALAGILYLSFREISRLLFLYFVVLQLGLTSFLRLVLHLWACWRQGGRGSWKTLIVGCGDEALQICRAFRARGTGYGHIVGFLSDHPERSVFGEELPYLGSVENLSQVVSDRHVNEVIVAPPNGSLGKVVDALYRKNLSVEVRAVPEFVDVVTAHASFETLDGVPLIGVRVPAITGFDWVIKRCFDVILASLLLMVLAPVMLLVAILITLESPGSPLFRQQRVGEHGRLFWMFKFRTMYQNAEHRLASLIQRSPEGKPLFKTPNDPRITRIGRILRRFSLDELPQLVNVLMGDMSLVGPRPEQMFIVREYEPWQYKRFAVPPGITGWWQVTQREVPLHLCTERDLFYILNYSFLLDLKILMLTFWAVLRGRGAH